MDKRKTVRIGVIGCGIICRNYLANMVGVYPWIEVVACSDLDMANARAIAADFPGIRPMSTDELLADRSIDLVVNLTIPAVHAEITMKSLEAGKHVYSEKPLGLDPAECRNLCEAAAKRKLLLGCAADTFLGGGIQTLIKVIREGAIGKVIDVSGSMLFHGPEAFHPRAEFLYRPGAGPLFDMGPYYLNTFIAILGPVKRVTGIATRGASTRYFGNGPRIPKEQVGRPIDVEVDTHVKGFLEFACGAVGMLAASWDVWATETPNIEIHGTRGSIVFTDPNSFTGVIRLRRGDDAEWREIQPVHCTECGRGIGIADMADAILHGRKFRATGEMASHVVEIMHSILEAAQRKCWIELQTTCSVPEPLPPWLPAGSVGE